MHNILRRCSTFRCFTFISDRDKSIVEAMQIVFPDNHHMHCAVHIERNVLSRFGMPSSKCIQIIAKTFSIQKERVWRRELKETSAKAYDYVIDIEPNTWRNSSWSRDELLPPRYGITSSNISDSTN
jgi:transposase-like protein